MDTQQNSCFVESVHVASRRHIPSGSRTEYVSCLTEESKSLYEADKCKYSISPFDNGTIESGNILIDKMTEGKRKRWEEVITSTNMTHNSRKVWKTIRKLSNDPTTSNPPYLVSAKQDAQQLLVNGRGTMPSKLKHSVLPPVTEGDYSMVYLFSEEEYRKGVAILKNNKASGRDDVLVEQLKNLGAKYHRWLLTMLNKCFMENKIPTLWRQDYCHTEAWEELCNSKELQTNIPLVSYLQTLRKNDTEQNSTNHRTSPN